MSVERDSQSNRGQCSADQRVFGEETLRGASSLFGTRYALWNCYLLSWLCARSTGQLTYDRSFIIDQCSADLIAAKGTLKY